MSIDRLNLATVATTLAAALGLSAHVPASGADSPYPNKSVRIVTALAGGGGDLVARMLGLGLAAGFGQTFIVDNRGAIPAAEIVAKAAPDGYTLLSYGTTVWQMPLLRDHVPWHPIKSYTPIMLTVTTPSVLVVPANFPAQTVKDLIALAKAKPGELNYGSSGSGSAGHLAAELFKQMAGVDILRVPYKGNATIATDLAGGRVQLSFLTPPTIAPLVKAGKLKAIAVSSLQPSPLAPGLPSVASSGLPGYESTQPYGMFAPAGTPTPVITRLHQELTRFLSKSEVKDQFLNAGFAAIASSPAELTAFIKADMAKMGKVIKSAGIRDE